MGLRINFNDASVTAYRNLAANQSGVSKAVERLSSGYKINRGADDPAGLVRSEGLRAQISGLAQAMTNAQDAANMVKTTEGALTEVNTLLRSMRTLAVHAASAGTANTQTLAADQSQITSALQSINNIANRTAFGSTKLLDGTASLGFDTITAGGDGATADYTAVRAASTGSAFMNATGNKAVTIAITQDASKATKTGAATLAANAALSTAGNWNASMSTQITVNGVNVGTFAAANKVEDVVNAINNNATLSQTLVASRTGNHVTLATKGYGSSEGITVQESITNNGANAAGAVDYIVANGTAAAADLTAGATAATTVTAWGTDIKGTVTGNGVGGGTVDFNAGTGFTLKDAAGDSIAFSTAMVGTAAGSATYATHVTGSGTVFQIGSEANETVAVTFNSAKTASLGLSASSTFASLSDVDVTSNAQEAIKVIDQAIKDISTQRADMGAFQKNVLESTMASLSVTKENVSASESAIRDADMAEEMSNFSKFNILQQAGISMLAQANQTPQQLLKLLG